MDSTKHVNTAQSCSSLDIQSNVSLREKNWFNTGGHARFFCQPQSIVQFQEALSFAHKRKLDVFVLGKGANVLISDAGFNGLVINPALRAIKKKHISNDCVHVTAGAGTSLDTLISFCLEHNLLGLEEFSGIPGTVGGAVYINLHYFSFLLEQFLVKAAVIHKGTGTILVVDRSWFAFGYDFSTLHNKEYFLLDATFQLRIGSDQETAFTRGRSQEIIRHRIARYPSQNTCGSFFRNFHDNEVTLLVNNKKAIWVAYYLDKIGIKGHLRCGDAQVSYQHANMIVNLGNASSNDIIELARTMQQMVQDTYEIIPQPECELVGFERYPLLK